MLNLLICGLKHGFASLAEKLGSLVMTIQVLSVFS